MTLALALAPFLAVLAATVIGVLTLRHYQRMRFLSATVELVHAMQAAEFAKSIAVLLELPEDAPATRVLGDGAATMALYTVSHVFETLGVLVYHRLLPLHLVDDLIGGYARSSWKRTHLAVEARRASFGATFGEWFEWLTDRLEQYPAPGKGQGAAKSRADWKP
jgi:hypothetical protein